MTERTRYPSRDASVALVLLVVLVLLLVVALVVTVQHPTSEPATPLVPASKRQTVPLALVKLRDPRVPRLRRRLQSEARQLAVLRRPRRVSISGDWLARAFLCIHRFEGSWSDPAAPYFGGLQMDSTFMRTYGANFVRMWGTANHWPAFVQVAVAMNAYATRGFEPWPNTSRMCGLR